MGMDLTLFMVDWERLGAVPVEDRIGLLEDMAWPWGPEEPYDLGRGRADGRLRPPGPEPAWCAEYSFLTTNGAHMPHVRAGSAWAGMRSLVDASVREPMDTFLDGLVRDAGRPSPAVRGSSRLPPIRGIGTSCWPARRRCCRARRGPGNGWNRAWRN